MHKLPRLILLLLCGDVYAVVLDVASKNRMKKKDFGAIEENIALKVTSME